MSSKPDVFIVIPPPIYVDGKVEGSMDLLNGKIIPEISNIAKECGVADDQMIDLYNAMGGQDLQKPHLFCDERWCDGFHPVDKGQDIMAREILIKIMNFYIKNPQGRHGSK